MAADTPKIFGTFDLHEPHKLRAWETYFGIEDRVGTKAGKSKYHSIPESTAPSQKIYAEHKHARGAFT